MKIIIWFLLIVMLLIIIYICLFKREIRNIKKQLGIIANCKTNAIINANFIDADLIDLINMINRASLTTNKNYQSQLLSLWKN